MSVYVVQQYHKPRTVGIGGQERERERERGFYVNTYSQGDEVKLDSGFEGKV